MDKPHSPAIKKGAAYPKEFRVEAVRYWLNSGKKAKVIAQELGVSDWSLNRWRQEMEEAHRCEIEAKSVPAGAISQRSWLGGEMYIHCDTGLAHRPAIPALKSPDGANIVRCAIARNWAASDGMRRTIEGRSASD